MAVLLAVLLGLTIGLSVGIVIGMTFVCWSIVSKEVRVVYEENGGVRLKRESSDSNS